MGKVVKGFRSAPADVDSSLLAPTQAQPWAKEPQRAFPTRPPMSVYQNALRGFLSPKHHALLTSWDLLQEGSGGPIAAAGMLGPRKLKKLASHPWMGR